MAPDLTVVVKNSKTLSPLSGVTVSADGLVRTTDGYGVVLLPLLPMTTYTIKAEKSGYVTKTQTMMTPPYTIQIGLNLDPVVAPPTPTPATHKLTVTVVNSATGAPVSGAKATFDATIVLTDSAGKAAFTLTDGKAYAWNIEAYGYSRLAGSYLMPAADATMTLKLIPVPAPAPTVEYVSLKIEIQGQGTTSPPPQPLGVVKGKTVTVTAAPASGWYFSEWLLDGTSVSKTSTYVVTMDRNHVLTAVFLVTPTPKPPDPATVKVEATCTSWGYYWYDGACHAEPRVEAPPPKVDVPSTGNILVDPIIAALWPVVQGFFTLLQAFGRLFVGPVETGVRSAITEITAGVKGSSPKKVDEAEAKRLAEAYRLLLEDQARKIVKGSPAIEMTPTAAGILLSTLMGVQVSVEILSHVVDKTHPLRAMHIPDTSRAVMGSLGMYGLTSGIATMPAEVGILTPLRYWYQKQYTPLIPSLTDLIVMLVREVITPEQYAEYASWHGESAAWAGKRWEAHWRTVPPEMVHDAYHRGLIKEDQWNTMVVYNDFKPQPRRSGWTADLDIVRGLRKTLIPRVDLRRGWELGLLDDARLLDGYTDLGYEADAPLMAQIQKATALDAEITMLKRELLAWYERGLMTEKLFVTRLRELDRLRSREWYWVQLGRLRKARKAEEPLPAFVEVPTEAG